MENIWGLDRTHAPSKKGVLALKVNVWWYLNEAAENIEWALKRFSEDGVNLPKTEALHSKLLALLAVQAELDEAFREMRDASTDIKEAVNE